MIKNVLIVEDNKAALTTLYKTVEELDIETKIFTASDSKEAYQKAIQYTIDVFIVDIILDTTINADVSGIEFAERIRRIEKYAFTPIIFMGALTDQRYYTFTSVHGYAYFEKPYEKNEIRRMIKDALQFTTKREEERNLFFRKDGLLFAVNTKDIVYIENSFHKLNIQTVDEIMKMPYKSCQKLLEEIESSNFIQCSRSTIVNMKYVKALDPVNRYLMLKGDYGRLEVGNVYIKKVKENLK